MCVYLCVCVLVCVSKRVSERVKMRFFPICASLFKLSRTRAHTYTHTLSTKAAYLSTDPPPATDRALSVESLSPRVALLRAKREETEEVKEEKECRRVRE